MPPAGWAATSRPGSANRPVSGNYQSVSYWPLTTRFPGPGAEHPNGIAHRGARALAVAGGVVSAAEPEPGTPVFRGGFRLGAVFLEFPVRRLADNSAGRRARQGVLGQAAFGFEDFRQTLGAGTEKELPDQGPGPD